MAPVALAAVFAAIGFGPPAHSPAARTFTYAFGPIAVGPYQALRRSNAVRTPSLSGAVVRMSARVVDSRGRAIPQSQVMLHHLVFFDGGRPGASRHDNTCGTRRTPQRFFGTSEELRDLTLPAGYGYRVDGRDRWTSSWMVMNHTPAARRAWIRYRVTIDPSRRVEPVDPYWVSVAPCGADPQYSVRGGGPPGSTSTRRRTWTVPRSDGSWPSAATSTAARATWGCRSRAAGARSSPPFRHTACPRTPSTAYGRCSTSPTR